MSAQPAASSPVFTDPTGRRVTVLRWLAWAVCGAFCLAVVSVVFTLVTQVPLPGLGGLVPDRPDTSAPGSDPAGDDSRQRGLDADSSPEGDDVPIGVVVRDQPDGPAGRDRGAGASGEPGAATDSADSATPVVTPAGAGPPATEAPRSPNENADPRAGTRPRNARAEESRPTPGVVREPNEHAATGRGRVSGADNAASVPPGKNK